MDDRTIKLALLGDKAALRRSQDFAGRFFIENQKRF